MPVLIQTRFDLAPVRGFIEKLSRVGRNLRPVLGRIGMFIRREAVRLLRSRDRGWGPPTGRLAQSLALRIEDFSVTVGTNLIYGAIQQLGGDVAPKGHKYLAIPVLSHLRKDSVWPRDVGGMKFVKAATIRIGSHSWVGPALVRASDQEVGGPWQGAGKRPRREGHIRPEGEVMFALVKHVHIQGRPYLWFSAAAQEFSLIELKKEYLRATA